MEHQLFHTDGNPRNSEGSFIKLKSGRIMFAYSGYYGDDSFDDCPANICAVTSDDGGVSWSDPFILIKNDALNLMSVSLLRLQDDRIALMYIRKDSVTGYPDVDCRPFIRFSSDEAETWSDPIDVVDLPHLYLVVNNDRLVQLKNGRIIFPGSLHRYVHTPSRLADGIGLFFYSDDGGLSWKQSKGVCYPDECMPQGLMEPGIIELENGKLMCWFRTTMKCQYKSFSYDNGETWSHPVPAPEFMAPSSPLSMKRNPATGELVAIWNDHHPLRSVNPQDNSMGYRTPLVMAKSFDNGVSWQDHTAIENSPIHGYAYTAIMFEQDKIFLAYCCGNKLTCKRMLQDLKIKII